MNVQLCDRLGDLRSSASRRVLTLAGALALGLTPLAACERHAMTRPDSPPAPMAPPAPTLDGRPDASTYPPPPSQPMTPMDAPSAAPATGTGGPGVVAMEPIANPSERQTETNRTRRPTFRGVPTSKAKTARRIHVHAYPAPAPAPVLSASAANQTPTPVAANSAPREVGETAPAAHAKAHTARTASAAVTDAGAERASHVAALKTYLAGEVQHGAVLSQPETAAPEQAGTVTLTLPADFAANAHTEAGRNGLADAAASMNLAARLSGDGYTVLPQDVQSQPLIAGQPTRFSWTVSAARGVKGPLTAHVGAALLGGGGDQLDLGTVSMAPKGADLGLKITGAALLILAVGGLLALLANRRRADRTTEVRQRRPLDMMDDRQRP